MSTIGPSQAPFDALLIVLALIFADWLLGILAALRVGTFALTALPRQLVTFVLPYGGAAAIAWGIQWLAQNVAVPGTAAAGAATLFSYFADVTIVPKALADIAAKLATIGGGGTPPTLVAQGVTTPTVNATMAGPPAGA